jgi:hypothetical protein
MAPAMKVWDKDTVGSDDFLGEFYLNFAKDLTDNATFDKWIPVKPRAASAAAAAATGLNGGSSSAAAPSTASSSSTLTPPAPGAGHMPRKSLSAGLNSLKQHLPGGGSNPAVVTGDIRVRGRFRSVNHMRATWREALRRALEHEKAMEVKEVGDAAKQKEGVGRCGKRSKSKEWRE